MIARLCCLDHPISGRARHEAAAQGLLGDGLVMVRVDYQRLVARCGREAAANTWRQLMHDTPLPVVAGCAMSLDVLNEGAAVRDVENLEAAADPEDRQLALDRQPSKLQLLLVADGVDANRSLVFGAVTRRVDVPAAAEQQPIERVRNGITGIDLDDLGAGSLKGGAVPSDERFVSLGRSGECQDDPRFHGRMVPTGTECTIG